MSGVIRLVLFDFGGVLAPEGFQLGILKLAHRFGMSFEEMYDIAGRRAAFESGYTAGKSGEERYWEILEKYLNSDKPLRPCRDYFLDNFQPRKEMLELAESLEDRVGRGIFSDQTNWIYELDSTYGFIKLFEYVCVSYDKGLTKHDEEFYRLPSRETGLDPSEILLIDDKDRVLDMARSAGMLTYKLVFVSECIEYINSLSESFRPLNL